MKFICPLCKFENYKKIKFLPFYRCQKCTVIFTKPERFSVPPKLDYEKKIVTCDTCKKDNLKWGSWYMCKTCLKFFCEAHIKSHLKTHEPDINPMQTKWKQGNKNDSNNN